MDIKQLKPQQKDFLKLLKSSKNPFDLWVYNQLITAIKKDSNK